MEDRKTLFMMTGIMAGTILLITAFAFLASKPVKPVNVEVDKSYFKGKVDAKVTVVEFSDFQCPSCETFATTVLPELEKTYQDSVKFVYKFFPLYEIHSAAKLTAQSAWCAGQVDKAEQKTGTDSAMLKAEKNSTFWQYHDLLMGNVSEWEGNPDKLNEYAKRLNLNEEEFKKCQNSQEAIDAVIADRQQGNGLGVNSTPTFYVNGEQMVGLQSLENWKKIIDQKLNSVKK